MTPPDAPLSRLLTLVEQWSAVRSSTRTDAEFMTEYYRLNDALRDFDLLALRAAAQQHAEALRDSPPLTGWGDKVLAAADFLDPKEEA